MDPEDQSSERPSDRAQERAERRRRRRERRRGAVEEADARWGDRKERVLHTRISERLSEDIRQVAEDLRVPVSNVVRNVLEDVFSVVSVVTDNVGDLIDEIVEEADRARAHLGRRARRERPASGTRDVSESGADKPESTVDERGQGRARPEFPEVLGWQPLILNAAQTCKACDRELGRGDRAFVGMIESGLSSIYLCRRCASATAPPP
ncbi:MAG: hypothetical protein V3T14_07665 [Myxococcota bacterium]